MASRLSIQSAPNSFFQLGNPINFNCVEPIELCLPIYKDYDLYGWSLYVGYGSGITYYWRLVKNCNQPVGDLDPASLIPFHVYNYSDKVQVLTPLFYQDPSETDFGVDGFDCGECFFIQVIKFEHKGDVINQDIVGCIGCFQKICDPCYTSVVQYINNENAFGFLYTNGNPNTLNGLYNRVRLPLYLNQPQFPVKRNVFTLSNGMQKKLSSRIEKEWNVETDYMPKEWHEKLVIALEHDHIGMQNVNSNTFSEFMNESNYEINWQAFLDYPTAPAKFKLKQIPYNNVNSNCL